MSPFLYFCRFPTDLLSKLSTDCLAMQNHHVCFHLHCFVELFNIRT